MFFVIIMDLCFANYCTWQNFGGGKFWRINTSKAFGVEKFGESALSQSKNPAHEPVSSVSVSSTCLKHGSIFIRH